MAHNHSNNRSDNKAEQEDLRKKLKKINDNIYEVPREGAMKIPGRIFVNEKLLKEIDTETIKQVMNAATLPGVLGYSIAMPDMHRGYGFSIGGVVASDAENGMISPGGVGFDINCGVRFLVTALRKEEVEKKINELLNEIYKLVPCGVGEGGEKISKEDLDEVMKKGAEWCVEKGYGYEEDLKHCESNGTIPGAKPEYVSPTARKRGVGQLGSLGAGNHFMEIQVVNKIFNKEIAQVFGIKEEGQICVMIHCGSRGLGHQVCSDYIREMQKADPVTFENLPDKDLVYAKTNSELAKQYICAMNSAANFAFANRHMIMVQIRKAFNKVFGVSEKDIKLVYDICHNMAKLEEHNIDGKMRKVYVHRKGATRSFPPGHPELPEEYQKTGQPIMIPGSMGTASYVLVGTEDAMKQSFGSTAHGAGRLMSRHEANQRFRGEQIKKELEVQKIYVKAASWKGVSEEAPKAYKDVDEVVKVSDAAGIGNLVVRVVPLGVVKG